MTCPYCRDRALEHSNELRLGICDEHQLFKPTPKPAPITPIDKVDAERFGYEIIAKINELIARLNEMGGKK